MSAKPAESTNGYSSFCPVLVVFVTMAVVQTIYLRAAFKSRGELNARRAEVQQVIPQAQLISQTVENVGKDLFALSDGKSNEAAKIIAEFNIQMNTGQPATGTNAAPAKAPPAGGPK